MIKTFEYNRRANVAYLTLDGSGSRREVDNLRLIPVGDRWFVKERWVIKNAARHAFMLRDLWPEFLGLVRSYHQQPELFPLEMVDETCAGSRNQERAL